MREERQIAVLITSVFLIGAVGLLLTEEIIGSPAKYTKSISDQPLAIRGDVYVDEYRADFYLNGTLEERFVYQIRESGKYRMLYRNFKDRLASEKLTQPSIELVEVRPPESTTSYIKDWSGKVEIISGDCARVSEVQSLASINEDATGQRGFLKVGTK